MSDLVGHYRRDKVERRHWRRSSKGKEKEKGRQRTGKTGKERQTEAKRKRERVGEKRFYENRSPWMCGRRLLEHRVPVYSRGRYSLRLWNPQRSDQKNRLVRSLTIQQSLPGYACPHMFLTPHFPRSHPFLIETKRLQSTASLLLPAPRLLLILRHQRERWLSRTVSETQSPAAPRLRSSPVLPHIHDQRRECDRYRRGSSRSKESARWRIETESDWSWIYWTLFGKLRLLSI